MMITLVLVDSCDDMMTTITLISCNLFDSMCIILPLRFDMLRVFVASILVQLFEFFSFPFYFINLYYVIYHMMCGSVSNWGALRYFLEFGGFRIICVSSFVFLYIYV